MAVLLELDGTWGEAVAFNAWLEKEGRVRRKATQRCADLNVPRTLRTMMPMCNERNTPVRGFTLQSDSINDAPANMGWRICAEEASGFSGVRVRALDQLSARDLETVQHVLSAVGSSRRHSMMRSIISCGGEDDIAVSGELRTCLVDHRVAN